ncbi:MULTISPECIES: metallophosphoesterase [Mycolicibacterium]|jgi:predicted MPP superfamily phosphohydrolase|uniref:Metallophosphoesterase n=1 Tax=Mycolicibacterium vanbaalenii (strain DSM 7251 / JCM 13017 / BCRC 16820 / KCTC 9966 / NRRL B-24157 / PYR-1) TaxID=350058 RepID=A1THC8_MYCVP|nr:MULTISPECIES: metallophosphoesterase [Mycolicibacterium]ABM16578.1 metallophosphoesterase [Mycolicibacterium vanbaalenii PYR-1]MCV7131132.1 metallophosphoesterase [Mycolicibacterium vanbaalenii PYR-1]MDW5609430.1 metallophosphoesterase [Mycolicibacterium sp. D5.8-2]PQP40242.1 metallophosphoesterase [Mycolicibacterium austroafricanum]QZT56951.1 metallophosphoesterase [Mycolicibacterium austroafricanum]
MSDNPAEAVEEAATPPRRSRGRWRRSAVVLAVMLLLFGVPWSTLVVGGAAWPTAVAVAGTLVFVAAFAGLPVAMMLGHGPARRDWAAVLGDALLGAAWVLFVWSVLGQLFEVVLLAAGVADPTRSRLVAAVVVTVAVGLLAWGYVEAMRVPRVKNLDVAIRRLGRGLDGLRVAVITDTHYGPIDRARWSAGVVERVNELDADVVCHVGDIADGTADIREAQASPLARVRARSARVYVTGNHEYFSEAQGWLDYMERIGWDVLHNRHVVVERGGDRMVVAGIDDATASGSGVSGHGADLDSALIGADRSLPVLLLAHQPKQVVHAVRGGVDLQISGHTHGGQIWPFNFLVRLEQPVVHGLSTHGDRTQLYTSRGTGFWGPPFRVFAPSEITVLTLRRCSSDDDQAARHEPR